MKNIDDKNGTFIVEVSLKLLELLMNGGESIYFIHPEYGYVVIKPSPLLQKYYEVFYMDIVEKNNNLILDEEKYHIPLVVDEKGTIQPIDLLYSEVEVEEVKVYSLNLFIHNIEKNFLIIEVSLEMILDTIESKSELNLSYFNIHLSTHLLNRIVFIIQEQEQEQEQKQKIIALVYDNKKDDSLELIGLLQKPNIEKGRKIEVITL
jgi:hypothetical protein